MKMHSTASGTINSSSVFSGSIITPMRKLPVPVAIQSKELANTISLPNTPAPSPTACATRFQLMSSAAMMPLSPTVMLAMRLACVAIGTGIAS